MNRAPGARSEHVTLYVGCIGPTVPSERFNALFKAVDQLTGTGALLAQRRKLRRPAGQAPGPGK